MPQEMVQEAVEIVTMSVDKFINVKNYEVTLRVLTHERKTNANRRRRSAVHPCFGRNHTPR